MSFSPDPTMGKARKWLHCSRNFSRSVADLGSVYFIRMLNSRETTASKISRGTEAPVADTSSRALLPTKMRSWLGKR